MCWICACVCMYGGLYWHWHRHRHNHAYSKPQMPTYNLSTSSLACRDVFLTCACSRHSTQRWSRDSTSMFVLYCSLHCSVLLFLSFFLSFFFCWCSFSISLSRNTQQHRKCWRLIAMYADNFQQPPSDDVHTQLHGENLHCVHPEETSIFMFESGRWERLTNFQTVEPITFGFTNYMAAHWHSSFVIVSKLYTHRFVESKVICIDGI